MKDNTENYFNPNILPYFLEMPHNTSSTRKNHSENNAT